MLRGGPVSSQNRRIACGTYHVWLALTYGRGYGMRPGSSWHTASHNVAIPCAAMRRQVRPLCGQCGHAALIHGMRRREGARPREVRLRARRRGGVRHCRTRDRGRARAHASGTRTPWRAGGRVRAGRGGGCKSGQGQTSHFARLKSAPVWRGRHRRQS